MIYTYVVAHFWPWFFVGGCVLIAAVVLFAVWWALSEPDQPADEWDDGWQVEPVTDEDAATMAAEWRGEPLCSRCGKPFSPGTEDDGAYCWDCDNYLLEDRERTVTRDVWDEWWAGLDGLDRECFLVRHAREREERLWAELLAETREMCAA